MATAVEGREVKTFFKDTEEFPVGDPYENYYQHNKPIPTEADHLCVPRINVFVQVYDDTCFNICEDSDNCRQGVCEPLKEEMATMGVTPLNPEDPKDPKLPSSLMTSQLLTFQKFSDYSEYLGKGMNTHVLVKYPGLYQVDCSIEDMDHYPTDKYWKNNYRQRFIKENIFIPCILQRKLNRNRVNEDILTRRGQKEIMKLTLDWSAPNPLIPRDLDLHFVMFHHDGEGVCSSYNPQKLSCQEKDPTIMVNKWNCGIQEIDGEDGKKGSFGYRLNDRCCTKNDQKFWKCETESEGVQNYFGPETAIIPDTPITRGGVRFAMVYILKNDGDGDVNECGDGCESDGNGEAGPQISNAELSISLQYEDTDKTEQLKHIYLKDEHVGRKKSAGNVYLAVCIKFNEDGTVEKLVRPPYPWLALSKENYAMKFTKPGEVLDRIDGNGSIDCGKCLPMFCGAGLGINYEDAETKKECCKCSQELNKMLDQDHKIKNLYPAAAVFNCT